MSAEIAYFQELIDSGKLDEFLQDNPVAGPFLDQLVSRGELTLRPELSDDFLPTLSMYGDPDYDKENLVEGEIAPFGGRKDVPFDEQMKIFERIEKRDDTFYREPFLGGDPELVMQKTGPDGKKGQAYVVPTPEQSFMTLIDDQGKEIELVDQDRDEFMQGVLRNAPSNFLNFASVAVGGVENLVNYFKDPDDPRYEAALQDYFKQASLDMPRVLAGDDPILGGAVGIGEYVPGAVGGFGLAKGLGTGIANVFAKFFGMEFGGATTTSPDAGTIIFGDNSLAKDVFGFEINPLGVDGELSDDQKLMAEKFNLVLDAAAGGQILQKGLMAPVAVAVKGIDLVSGAARKIFTGETLNDIDANIVKGILNDISVESPEEVKRLVNARIESILNSPEEFQNSVILNNAENNSNVVNQYLTTLQLLDKIGTRNIDDLTTDQLQSVLVKIRKLAEGTANMSETVEAKQSRLAFDIDESITRETDTLGGQEAGKAAGEALTKAPVEDVAGQLDEIELKRLITEEDLNTAIAKEAENSPLTKAINAWRQSKGQSRFQTLKAAKVDQVRESLLGVVKNLEDTRVALYDKVVGSSFADEGIEELIAALRQADKLNPETSVGARGSLGPFLDNLTLRSRPKRLPAIEANAELGIEEVPSRMETAEEVQERVLKYLENEGTDLGVLFREVRPKLRMRVNNVLNNAADVDKAGVPSMLSFIAYIDGAMDDLVARGTDTGEAGRAAREFYENSYAPVMKDNPVEEINKVISETRRYIRSRPDPQMELRLADDISVGARQTDEVVDEGAIPESTVLSLKPTKEAVEINRIIKTYVDDPSSAEYITKLASVLESAGPESRKDLSEYILLNVVDRIQDSLALGVDSQQFSSLMGAVKQYGVVLRSIDSSAADQLDALLSATQKKVGQQGEIQKQIDVLTKQAQESKDKYLNSAVGNFLKSQGDRLVYGKEPRKALAKVLNSEDAVARLEELMVAARNTEDPRVIEGLQVLYLQNLRKSIFVASGGTPLKGSRVSQAGLEKVLGADEASIGSERMLNIIFEDRPELAQGYRALLESLGDAEKIGSAGRATIGSDTSRREQLRKAIENLGIVTTVVFGRLSREGAVAQSIGGKVIRDQTRGIDDKFVPIFADLMSNPESFAKAFKKMKLNDAYLAVTDRTTLSYIIGKMINTGVIRPSDRYRMSEEDLMTLSMQLQEDLKNQDTSIDSQMNALELQE